MMTNINVKKQNKETAFALGVSDWSGETPGPRLIGPGFSRGNGEQVGVREDR